MNGHKCHTNSCTSKSNSLSSNSSSDSKTSDSSSSGTRSIKSLFLRSRRGDFSTNRTFGRRSGMKQKGAKRDLGILEPVKNMRTPILSKKDPEKNTRPQNISVRAPERNVRASEKHANTSENCTRISETSVTAAPEGVTNTNIVVVGDKGVGKSAITVRFLTRRYIGEYSSDTELMYEHASTVDQSPARLHLLDTTTTQSPHQVVRHLPWAHAFIVVYDVTNRTSFIHARHLLHVIHTQTLTQPHTQSYTQPYSTPHTQTQTRPYKQTYSTLHTQTQTRPYKQTYSTPHTQAHTQAGTQTQHTRPHIQTYSQPNTKACMSSYPPSPTQYPPFPTLTHPHTPHTHSSPLTHTPPPSYTQTHAQNHIQHRPSTPQLICYPVDVDDQSSSTSFGYSTPSPASSPDSFFTHDSSDDNDNGSYASSQNSPFRYSDRGHTRGPHNLNRCCHNECEHSEDEEREPWAKYYVDDPTLTSHRHLTASHLSQQISQDTEGQECHQQDRWLLDQPSRSPRSMITPRKCSDSSNISSSSDSKEVHLCDNYSDMLNFINTVTNNKNPHVDAPKHQSREKYHQKTYCERDNNCDYNPSIHPRTTVKAGGRNQQTPRQQQQQQQQHEHHHHHQQQQHQQPRPHTTTLLLANKRDLEHCRVVWTDEGEALSLEFSCQFYEVSAAESLVGVHLAFHSLLKEARAQQYISSLPQQQHRSLPQQDIDLPQQYINNLSQQYTDSRSQKCLTSHPQQYSTSLSQQPKGRLPQHHTGSLSQQDIGSNSQKHINKVSQQRKTSPRGVVSSAVSKVIGNFFTKAGKRSGKTRQSNSI